MLVMRSASPGDQAATRSWLVLKKETSRLKLILNLSIDGISFYLVSIHGIHYYTLFAQGCSIRIIRKLTDTLYHNIS